MLNFVCFERSKTPVRTTPRTVNVEKKTTKDGTESKTEPVEENGKEEDSFKKDLIQHLENKVKETCKLSSIKIYINNLKQPYHIFMYTHNGSCISLL